jgi:hypothetical protein
MSCRGFILAFMVLVARQAHATLVTGEECATFDRASAHTSSAAREYFSTSTDSYVQICRKKQAVSDQQHAGKVFGFGATAVSVRDGVCEFTSHELRDLHQGSGDVKLQPIPGEGTSMMTSAGEVCPEPFSPAYTASYGITPASYRAAIAAWRRSLSSTEAFDATYTGLGMHGTSPNDVAALRRAVANGSARALRPVIIERIRHLGIMNRYRLSVSDPEQQGKLYVFSITEWLGERYTISALGVGFL